MVANGVKSLDSNDPAAERLQGRETTVSTSKGS